MEENRKESSPRPTARATGVVYLLYFLTAFFGAFLLKGLIVPDDAAATVNNIWAHEASYRAGSAVGLIANVIYIAVTALFYRLFGPVNWNLSLVAAFVSVVGCAIQISGSLLQLAPFLILRDSQLSHAFSVEQLQAAALMSLTLYAQVFNISLVIFACYDLLLGYLIFKSTFLPRLLGALLMCAGVGWLAFVWPPLAAELLWFVLPFGALAEIVLMLWLLVKGVSVSRWQEKAATVPSGRA